MTRSDREQKARDAVVKAAMQWNRAKRLHEIALGQIAIQVACARLAAIHKKEKRPMTTGKLQACGTRLAAIQKEKRRVR